ncbi:MAG: insulinase family protein [Erysipelothrix sp.]|nr:insulinase family protein [Erysipelothrix sp.]
MIKNVSSQLKETQYIEVLDNGLTVVVVTKPGFRSNTAVLGTHYGAINLSQKVGEQMINYNAGIAHFLEHKLFEHEQEDILSVFTNLGASANAFTSYNETVYYFSNIDDISVPLNLLLDFVQLLSITDESVEKEKGIIIEEIKMYQQQPSFQLSMETLKSLYSIHPLNNDIAGTVESVTNITKDELELAYQTNYHPSQLVLSIVTHHSVEDVMSLVKANQASKQFVNLDKVENVLIDEPKSVNRPYYELEMNVKTPKISLAFKQDLKFNNYLEMLKARIAMRFLLEMTFTNLNPRYQQWLDDKVINDYFNFQNHYGLDFAYLQFVSEGNQLDAFVDFVTDELSNLKINEKVLKQLSRRMLGEAILDLQDFESLAIDGMRSQFMDVNLFDVISLAHDITVEDLVLAKNSINLDEKAVILLKNFS